MIGFLQVGKNLPWRCDEGGTTCGRQTRHSRCAGHFLSTWHSLEIRNLSWEMPISDWPMGMSVGAFSQLLVYDGSSNPGMYKKSD